MKPPSAFFISFLGCAVCAIAVSRAFAQGPLMPPAAPAASMKTLDQIEPRTLIPDLPFSIEMPGSYYLGTNLFGESGKEGIIISSHDVTVDLNGFSLTGVAGSLHGISVEGSRDSIVIRNGTVRGWGQYGINASLAKSSHASGLRLIDNGLGETSTAGLFLGSGLIENCIAEGNGGSGLRAGTASSVRNCIARNNGTWGIHAQTGSSVLSCQSISNEDDGIVLTSSGSILHCSSVLNNNDGIEVGNDSYVFGNTCRDNGDNGTGAGIHVTSPDNRIDSNNVIANETGILVVSSGSLIVRNSSRGNGGGASNYVVHASSSLGEVVNVFFSGPFTNSNPWANFSY